MSDFFIRFIPDDPQYKLNTQETDSIKKLEWYNENISINAEDSIQFADAGSNFESVVCPFCKADLMDWWGEAMDRAFSEENGFTDLSVITPCCNGKTSLHDLDYYFPQGFYQSMIEMPNPDIDKEIVCEQLYKITNKKWRVINAHY
jgi:hypothetical protein